MAPKFLATTGASAREAPASVRPLLDRRIDRLSGGQYQLLSLWACLGSPAGFVCLSMISRRLLLGRFFPEHFQANRITNPRRELALDLVYAVALAIAASVVGAMAAFALVLVPPWIAFHVARGWRRTLAWVVGLGRAAHVVSFATAPAGQA